MSQDILVSKSQPLTMEHAALLVTFTLAVILPFLPVLAQQVPLKEILISLLGKIFG